jgi:hypothetical protein
MLSCRFSKRANGNMDGCKIKAFCSIVAKF